MMWCVDLDRADVVLLRHGETTYNAAHLLNGDPSVEVPLTDAGIAQIRALRAELAGIPWAAVVVTPFGRTRQSLDELLPGRAAIVDPDLGDIRPRRVRVAAAGHVPRLAPDARRRRGAAGRRVAPRGRRALRARAPPPGRADASPGAGRDARPADPLPPERPRRRRPRPRARAARAERDAVPVHARDARGGRPTPRSVARLTSRVWLPAPSPISRSSAHAFARSTPTAPPRPPSPCAPARSSPSAPTPRCAPRATARPR